METSKKPTPPPRRRVAVASPNLKMTDEGRIFEKRIKGEFADLMKSVRGVVHDKATGEKCCTALARIEAAVLGALLVRFGEEG